MSDQTGRLKLVFRKKQTGITYVPQAYFTEPMRVVSPFYEDDDGTAFLYLLNLSGGVVGGDMLLTDVTVEDHARALLTTTSANKLYRMVPGKRAVIRNDFTVGEDGVLEYLPECSIPFAESETIQNSEFRLSESSYLFTVDAVTPGRIDRGELFSFREYTSNVKIYVDDRLMVYEKTRIRPDDPDLFHDGVMEAFTHYASVYIYHADMDRSFVDEVNRMNGQQADRYAGDSTGNDAFKSGNDAFRAAATLIDDRIAVIRILSNGMIDVENCIHRMWDLSRRRFLGKHAVKLRKEH